MNLLKTSYQFSHHFSPISAFWRNTNTLSHIAKLFTCVLHSKNVHKQNINSVSSLPVIDNLTKFRPLLINFINYRKFSIETLDEKTYELIADETLDLLTEKLENVIEKLDSNTSDIVFNNGVITLSLGSKGTFVINKQTPNRQIWLSSPISGPKRYDYMDGQWIYKRDGKSLEHLLKTELEELYETSVEL